MAAGDAVAAAAIVARAMDDNTTRGMLGTEIQSSMWLLSVKCDYRHTLLLPLYILVVHCYHDSNTG